MTNKECQCWAKIREDDPRSEIWEKVVEDRRIPLKHPLPVVMDGPEGPWRFYEGDPSKLTRKQHNILALEMKRKFGVPIDSVLVDLQNGRLPIKAEGCTVSWCSRHSRLAM